MKICEPEGILMDQTGMTEPVVVDRPYTNWGYPTVFDRWGISLPCLLIFMGLVVLVTAAH
jgi:hypothetical protein